MKGSIGGANGDGAINGDVLVYSVRRIPPRGSVESRVRLSFGFGEGQEAAFYLTLEESAGLGSLMIQCAGGKDPRLVNAVELGALVAELVGVVENAPRSSWIGRWRDRARLALGRLRAKELELRQGSLFGRDARGDASLSADRRKPGDGP